MLWAFSLLAAIKSPAVQEFIPDVEKMVTETTTALLNVTGYVIQFSLSNHLCAIDCY